MNATPPAPVSDRRRRLRRRMGCAVAAALLLGGALASELILRVAFPETYAGHGMFVPDELLSYTLKPNHSYQDVAINSHGLRDPERPVAKPEGSKRVLVLGDSFTFGSAIPAQDGFVRLLETALGEGVQTINSGVPGWSTVQQANWFERDGLAYDPDVVVVAFFVGNDVWENLDPDALDVIDGELVQKTERAKRSWWRVTRNRSRLYRLLKGMPEQISDAVTGDSTLKRKYHRLERKRMGICATQATETWEPGWVGTHEALSKIKRLAGDRPCVLLVIPDEFQVDPALREAVATRFELDLEGYDFELPQRRLAKLAAELGYTHVDVLDALRAQTLACKRQYLDLDSHWNAAGNALAARRLAACPPLAALEGE